MAVAFPAAEPLPRRTVLRGVMLGTTFSVALPWLEAMQPKRARAAGIPRRFACFFKPNGMAGSRAHPTGFTAMPDNFTPKTTGRNWASPTLKVFDALRNDITVLSNVDSRHHWNPDYPRGHNEEHLSHSSNVVALSPFPAVKVGGEFYEHSSGGRSMDYAIADKIGAGTRFPALQFGVMLNTNGVKPAIYMSFPAARTPEQPVTLPGNMWTKIFTDNVTGPSDPASLDRLRRQRKSALDAVKANIDWLKTRLGQADAKRLDAHLTSVRSLEQQISAIDSGASACVKPARPATLPETTANYPAIMKAQIDLLVMALACDVSRSATLMLVGGQGEATHNFVGVSEGHHALTHGGPQDKNDAVDVWQLGQAAYLIQSLKNIPEAGRSLLDSTTVLVQSDCSSGYHHNAGGTSWNNEVRPKLTALDFAMIVAGSPDYFTHGSHIRYKAGAVFHDQVLRACYESVTGLRGAAAAEWMHSSMRDRGPYPGFDGQRTPEMV